MAHPAGRRGGPAGLEPAQEARAEQGHPRATAVDRGTAGKVRVEADLSIRTFAAEITKKPTSRSTRTETRPLLSPPSGLALPPPPTEDPVRVKSAAAPFTQWPSTIAPATARARLTTRPAAPKRAGGDRESRGPCAAAGALSLSLSRAAGTGQVGCVAAGLARAVAFVLHEQGEQCGHRQARFRGVAQDLVGLDAVGVGAAVAGVGEVTVLLEVGDDPLDGAFGEPAVGGDVADPDVRIVGDGRQHTRVIGDERPSAVRARHFNHAQHSKDSLCATPDT
ncbi:hypothetical protein SAM23877_0083 [Streptomyces ambofaciens ATCC 23877]|uniref:Uncharacterized protein n=1 Tax=Streptomyces ambofaciens (strain ATCC 23877 / 3486 / DSM 40053 / JCM 4204 / NBRC 12836 / NRRL B-2516) TaxID=278992 RepID=A0A0K2AJV7_STRA7|nr:hypothetical protein SAM23877_0083 [Streptomyces ambofaciens ATCC 23877]